MSGEAKDLMSEKVALVEVDFDGGYLERLDRGSWPHAVQALLRRFITDEELRKAHDAWARADHTDREDEGKFVEKIS